MTYLLSHGFGFSNKYWDNLIPFFDNDFEFFDENFTPDSSTEYIGIGHSIGFQKLNNSKINFKYLVGLQGFLNFCGNEKTQREFMLHNIDRMYDAFSENIEKAISVFYDACGNFISRNHKYSKQQLLNDLNDLKNSYEHCGAKTLIIACETDKILPISIVHDNFQKLSNVEIKYIENVDHVMGLREASKVFKMIKEFCGNN